MAFVKGIFVFTRTSNGGTPSNRDVVVGSTRPGTRGCAPSKYPSGKSPYGVDKRKVVRKKTLEYVVIEQSNSTNPLEPVSQFRKRPGVKRKDGVGWEELNVLEILRTLALYKTEKVCTRPEGFII